MKNKTTAGITLAILGILIAVMPAFLIGQHCLGMKMKCAATAKAELGVGVLIVILALLSTYFESREIRLGISLSLACIGIFSALIPTALIGTCNNGCGVDCTCNPAAPLIMAGVSVLVVVISIVNLMRLNKK